MTVGVALLIILASAGSPDGPSDVPAASGAAAPVADAAGRLAEAVRAVLLPGWSMRRQDNTIITSGEVTTYPPSAESSNAKERHTYEVVVAFSPYLADEAQGSKLAAAEKLERRLWSSVAKLDCEGKEFSDHYVDGLCFRTKTDAQRRRVTAYRDARTALSNVPRHHFGTELAVSVRIDGPEPTDGDCAECTEMASRIGSLLSAYAELPAPPAEHEAPVPTALKPTPSP